MNGEERDRKQEQKIRNDANNADNVRNAANIAVASGNPYAVAAGKAVQVADKISGGKASEVIGKAVTKANKRSGLKGKMLQNGLNKMNESGTGDRLSQAMSKKNGARGNNPKTNAKSKANNTTSKNSKTKGLTDNSSKREKEENFSDGGGQNVKVTMKIIKIALALSAPIFLIMVFMCLLMAATQIMSKVIPLGQADSLGASDAEEKINKNDSDNLDEETTDETVYNYFIDDDYNNGLRMIARSRKYNEADLAELKDFYSGIVNYTEDYDMDMVYDFFFKLYDAYNYYEKNYKVQIDMPLLMSTLTIPYNDMNDVFKFNIVGYSRDNTEVFNYNTDWSSYNPSPKNSSHDIEVLIQHMVSSQSTETCVDSSGKETQKNVLTDSEVGTQSLTCADGETYRATTAKYAIDGDKYKEFLRQFLEEKYYINASSGTTNAVVYACPTETPFTKYDLTEEQLLILASVGAREQGTAKGAAAEASLMANLFELKGSKYGSGGNGLYNYVVKSGWFGRKVESVDTNKATPEVLAAVRSVLIDGKRTLPRYIDEHDCISCTKNGDISSVENNGVQVDKTDKNNYKKHISVLKNIYGSTYTFYSFPTEVSDPFGYTSEANRKEMGDFYYDYDTQVASDCGTTSINGTDLSSAFVSLAVAQLNDPSATTGQKYWSYMGFSSRVAWCAAFVSWNIYNTKYNGQKLSDIISYKSAAVYGFMNYFYQSDKPSLHFYYNDNCANYRGRNGDGTYTPKEGDLIFFDWQQNWSGAMPTCFECAPDHIGIVQRVEDGMIVTIEGNTSRKVGENRFYLNSCSVIAFGSWY